MAFINYIQYELKNLFRAPSTVKFPAEPREYQERYRGHIENDLDKCILCGACQRQCPSSAITVSKADYTWTLHPFSCVQCNHCVEVCPIKSLKMVNSYTTPGSEKSEKVFKYSEERIAREEEKKKAMEAKIAAAKAAAAAKAQAAQEAK